MSNERAVRVRDAKADEEAIGGVRTSRNRGG